MSLLPTPVRAVRAPARRFAWLGRNVWALSDQVLISGTNFVTMILVARGLGSPAEFGVFTLVYSALLFANLLQTSLVTQPLNVLGTARDGADYARYTTSTAISQFLLVLAEAVLALVAAAVAHSWRWDH